MTPDTDTTTLQAPAKLRILYVLEPDGIREATQAECKERVRWEIDADPKVIPFSGLLAVARGEGL